jgi:hypothetical protein
LIDHCVLGRLPAPEVCLAVGGLSLVGGLNVCWFVIMCCDFWMLGAVGAAGRAIIACAGAQSMGQVWLPARVACRATVCVWREVGGAAFDGHWAG